MDREQLVALITSALNDDDRVISFECIEEDDIAVETTEGEFFVKVERA